MEEFNKSLEESGLEKKFLYLFRLNDQQLEKASKDWGRALVGIIDSMAAMRNACSIGCSQV